MFWFENLLVLYHPQRYKDGAVQEWQIVDWKKSVKFTFNKKKWQH